MDRTSIKWTYTAMSEASHLDSQYRERIYNQLKSQIEFLCVPLIGREQAARLLLLSAVAGENIVFLGPPGVGKSLLARRLFQIVKTDNVGGCFEYLLNKFTVPSDLFGPLSVTRLKEDEYCYLTEGFLPSAAVAFLDEIFKANSAVLNALLSILNEKTFHNGSKPEHLDETLISVVGASNELPQEAALDALFDRFLLRYHISPLARGEFELLMQINNVETGIESNAPQLSLDDFKLIRQAAKAVIVPQDVHDLLMSLWDFVRANEIIVSDRRWKKMLDLLRVAAFTNQRDEVSIWDCWLVQHSFWNELDERRTIEEWYENQLAQPVDLTPGHFETLVNFWEKKLQYDVTNQPPKGFDKDDLNYRMSQIDERLKELVDHESQTQRTSATLDQEISSHLWVSPRLGAVARDRFDFQCQQIAALHSKLETIQNVYRMMSAGYSATYYYSGKFSIGGNLLSLTEQ